MTNVWHTDNERNFRKYESGVQSPDISNYPYLKLLDRGHCVVCGYSFQFGKLERERKYGVVVNGQTWNAHKECIDTALEAKK